MKNPIWCWVFLFTFVSFWIDVIHSLRFQPDYGTYVDKKGKSRPYITINLNGGVKF